MKAMMFVALALIAIGLAFIGWLLWSARSIERKYAEEMDKHIKEVFAPLVKHRLDRDKS